MPTPTKEQALFSASKVVIDFINEGVISIEPNEPYSARQCAQEFISQLEAAVHAYEGCVDGKEPTP